jgi:hypothetical protein
LILAAPLGRTAARDRVRPVSQIAKRKAPVGTGLEVDEVRLERLLFHLTLKLATLHLVPPQLATLHSIPHRRRTELVLIIVD